VKTAAVFGVGRMGQAICYAMDKLGFKILGVDSYAPAESTLRQLVPDADFILVEGKTQHDFELSLGHILDNQDIDIVISSLPYHKTKRLGVFCVDSGIRYCDLGGRVDVSESINDYARQVAEKPVLTDLGLAPGWVNILAEEGYRQLHGQVEDVKMMVGGLPDYSESTKNPLRYAVTWSTDGLINEYIDDCLILRDGEIETVKGMDGLEQIEGNKFGKMEAFYTSGGASHSIHSMKDRGVRNCSYKTIRYKGHRDIVNFLMRDCQLDDKTMEKIFLQGCGKAENDEVFVVAEVSGGDKVWRRERVIKSDEQFSAMQKATAFSISSVAAIMAQGKLEGNKEQRRDYWVQYPAALSYADIPFEEFKENLKILGIET